MAAALVAQFPQQWNLLLNGNTLPQSLKPPAGTFVELLSAIVRTLDLIKVW
jgi:hypothetical protein